MPGAVNFRLLTQVMTVAAFGQFTCHATCRVFHHYHRVSLDATAARIEQACNMSNRANDTNDVVRQRQRCIKKLSSTVSTEEISDDTNTDDDVESRKDTEHPLSEELIYALHDRVFVQPCHSSGNIQVRASTNFVVGVVGVVAVGFTLSGCILPVVSVDTGGVITDMILSNEEDDHVHTVALSLISWSADPERSITSETIDSFTS